MHDEKQDMVIGVHDVNSHIEPLVEADNISNIISGCQSCGVGGDLIAHLFNTQTCISIYICDILHNQHHYINNLHLSIFDIAILLNLCSNPQCIDRAIERK